ncbi:MAG: hypothetical protein AAF636_16330 [Pseudomonadota bacterium]
MRHFTALTLILAATLLSACADVQTYPVSGHTVGDADPVRAMSTPYGIQY